MNERERLIELLKNAKKYATSTMAHLNIDEAIDISYDDLQADYLLENGVAVLPCKIGDTVYRISVKATSKIKFVQKTTISRIAIDNEGVWLFCSCNPISRSIFGKNIFITKEEAEQALKGGAV